MIVYPAIDLRHGRCVRLAQGDFDRQTRYPGEPLEVARAYAASGATWLHTVDLDGARAGETAQGALIAELARDSGLRVQAGGGVRTRAHVAGLLDAGVARVVVGSLCVRDPALVAGWLREYGAGHITLALDVRLEGAVAALATDGWRRGGQGDLWDALAWFTDRGARHVLVTDIGRDGMLSGPNVGLYRDMARRFPGLAIQASGGVAGLDDLAALGKAGAAGVIVGKALYEGRFTLEEALTC